jgi:hypothetical protein
MAGGKLISCSESVGCMTADAVTFGAVRLTQETFRALSSEPHPDPASPGLNIPQVLAVLRGLRIVGMVDNTGDAWGALFARLNQDRRVILQVENAELHDCSSSRTGHMILLQAYRAGRGILANNPLCDAAHWYKPSVIRRAAEVFADATGVPGAGLRFAVTRPLPRVAVTV